MTAPPHSPRFDPERYAGRVAPAGAALVTLGLVLADRAGLVVGLAGVVLLLLAAYSRRDGLLLLGPLAEWELTRAARRRRLYALRVVFLLAGLVYLASAFAGLHGGYRHLLTGTPLPPNRAPRLAGDLAAVFGGAAVAVTLLGAVLTFPPVIPEERAANRLPHLFVTDLRNREILLGKLAARFAVLVGYVALVLPVLATLTWIGGFDPNALATGAVLTAAALGGVTGLALWASATAKSPAESILGAVVLVVLFFILTAMCEGLARLAVRYVPLAPPWPNRIADVLHFVGLGNPGVLGGALAASAAGGPAREQVVCHFAAGQFLLLAGGWAVAVRELRGDPRPTAPAAAAAPAKPVGIVPVRPPVWDEPVYWYEVTSVMPGPQPQQTRLARWLERGVAAVVIAAAVTVLVLGWFSPRGRDAIRILALQGSVFGFLFVTVPAVFIAARSVPWERAKDTLEALRLTGLAPAEILAQKWAAAITLTRPPLVFACACGAVLVAARCLHPVAAVLLAAAAVAAQYLAASVGLRVGLTAKTPARAVGRLALLAVAYGYALGFAVTAAGDVHRRPLSAALALTPPAGQLVTGFMFDDRRGLYHRNPGWVLAGSAVGWVLAAAGSRLAWQSACRAFDRMMTPAPDGAAGGRA